MNHSAPPRCADLSVVVPNFNHAAYLGAALDGILTQTLWPQEVIIIDDCSTDDSWRLIDSYRERYPDLIRVARNERNLGALATMERGFTMAHGNLLYFHSADDLIKPNCLATYVGLLERWPQAAVAVSRVATFRAEPSDYQWEPWRWTPVEGYYTPEQLASELQTRSFTSGQVMYRREAIARAGGFDRELHGFVDWFWIHAAIFRHGIAYTPQTLCLFRLTGDHSVGTSTIVDRAKNREVCAALLDRLHRPEHADLLPFFARSGVLHQLGLGMAETVLSDPRWWTPTVFALTHPNLHDWNEQAQRTRLVEFRSMAPTPVEEPSLAARLAKLAEECRARGWGRLALYGAGTHTRQVLELWRKIPDAPVFSQIIVTGPEAPAEFEGIPVQTVDHADLQQEPAVLLSSHRFESEMAAKCLAVHPSKPVLRIYTRP